MNTAGATERQRQPSIPGPKGSALGESTKGHRTPEWNAWDSMISRCHRPNHKRYADYGGRGIVVHEEWRGRGGYPRFLAHIGRRPSVLHSLDRIENNRGYEPGNVRWSTRDEQNRNRRSNVHITAFGRTQCLADWSRETGIPHGTIAKRIFQFNWPANRALTEPTTALAHARAALAALSDDEFEAVVAELRAERVR